MLSRPAVEAGERLGFLPGDMREKVDPYLRPLYDALHDMLPGEQVQKRMDSGEIEIAPLAFMRGRTLAQRLRHPRRGAEHHADADEDVPDPPGRELAHGGDRRSSARSTCRRARGRACADAVETLEDVDGHRDGPVHRSDVVRQRWSAEIVRAYDARDRNGARAGREGAAPQSSRRRTTMAGRVDVIEVDDRGGGLATRRADGSQAQVSPRRPRGVADRDAGARDAPDRSC